GEEAGATLAGCGAQPTKFSTLGLSIMMAYSQEVRDREGGERFAAKEALSAAEVYDVLSKTPIEDIRFLGFDGVHVHPRSFVMHALPVVPPCVRPCVVMGSKMPAHDDLTNKLVEIVELNQQVKKLKAENRLTFEMTAVEQLQWSVATYMHNDLGSDVPQAEIRNSQRPLKAIAQRLKGKEGRLRQNLMGKRVDFCGRTVITGDPTIAIDEVGIPFSVASNLTFPERVTKFNMGRLQDCVRNGPAKYPGANYIEAGDIKFDLQVTDPKSFVLNPGNIVHRHVRDGDYVLFNRQPSLHKMSLMGHRLK
ncbi:hypothetical protein KIPB_010784, partial [Kipferlia bialata]